MEPPAAPAPAAAAAAPALGNPALGNPARVYPDGPKQSAPFQFGTRLLLSEGEVFLHNAWDHVAPSSAYRAHTAARLAAQRLTPASPFDKTRFNSDPARWWDLFYKNNKENFFKDRKWLAQEFPLLAAATRGPEAGQVRIVELGCGAGNTLFPVLALNRNPRFCIHGVDFSRKAVEIVKAQPVYAECAAKGWVDAAVYDLSVPGALPDGVAPGSVDAVIMVFVFSALSPEQWSAALGNVRRMLRVGGRVLFRDYGRGDLAQVRFKAGRYLQENFYVRGDGTRVYFFELAELRRVFTGTAERGEGEAERWQGGRAGEGGEGQEGEVGQEGQEGEVEKEGQEGKVEKEGQEEEVEEVEKQGVEQEEPPVEPFPDGDFGGFAALEMGVDRRLIVNRKRQLKMYRCWLQAVFEKL